MNVVFGSAFRNSCGFPLQRYFGQIDAFKQVKPASWKVRVIAVEGDSVDSTRDHLIRFGDACGVEVDLVTRNHHQRVFGSTEEPERFRALSYVGNGILEAVRPDDDVLVYVESDLIWHPDVIRRLISRLGNGPIDVSSKGDPNRVISSGPDVIAPLIFAGEAFYDIWAFRKNGHRFGPFRPYHGDLGPELTAVDSAGSCLVMRAEVARNCRIIDNECLVGFCRDAWAKQYGVYVDARERIYHP